VAALLAGLRATAAFAVETVPSARRLRRLFAASGAELVYVCNGFRGNADAILAARWAGLPCVVHAKGFDKFTWVERRLSRRVRACVSMTRAIEDHCRRGGMRPDSFHVIYDGLDLDAFRPRRAAAEVRSEFGVAEDAEVAAVVGNVQPWKGQRVLVEALDLLARARPRLVVWIVGGVHRSGEDYAAEVRRLAEARGLGERVLWVGARGDVPDVMNAADVIVHTSVRGEPFGRVIIEAMAVGKPVVATRAGGVPEFVRDGEDALLVPPGDVAALAACLDDVLGSDDHRRRLATGARESARRFALPAHVDAMTAVFEEALGTRRTEAPQ
jgi:glycosyltransferase involved in cell wall biosynthesis